LLHDSKSKVFDLRKAIESGSDTQTIEELYFTAHNDLYEADYFLRYAMYLSFIHLFFPLNMASQKYYLIKNNNETSLVNMLSIIECSLFFTVSLWFYYFRMFRVVDPNNLFYINE
jgi:hypothetical protein